MQTKRHVAPFVVMALLLFSTFARAETLHVPKQYATIQACIDAAVKGDECVVAPGRYNEVIDFLGKAITLRSSDGADVTIIDGTELNSSVVESGSGGGVRVVLENFTTALGAPEHDCNKNGIDDADDIANCNGDPGCSDCNDDGRPDECGVPLTCRAQEEQKITASDWAAEDRFGFSVSVSGDTAVVGAYRNDCKAGGVCGAAYVYRLDGAGWVEEQKLTATDAAADDSFGFSVSVSGDTAIVGAYRDDCAAGLDCGAAYVYRFDGARWIQQQKLTATDAAAEDFFGYSVSVSGDTAVVGAYLDDCTAGRYCGSAYVYRFDGASWVEEQKLTATDAAASDLFGHSVSVSGDTAVVGAFGDDCAAGGNCGAAYVYRYDGASWIQQQKLTAIGAAAEDHFGRSVSVSGDTAVVGAYLDDCTAGDDCGSAYVYRLDGASWIQQQKLTATDAAANDLFGYSVSVSGDTAIVGAFFDDCAAGGNCGAAYVYRYDGASWIQQQKLTATGAAVADLFGYSVSVSGDSAVVGAYWDDCPAGSNCGSAYVFDLSGPDCNCNGTADACDIADCAGDPACGDCNTNGIPDECEFPDCNGNSVPDECELVGNDCNKNNIPDECDLPDCNGSGVPDECELVDNDCNDNGTPDECEIDADSTAPGGPFYCRAFCVPDCNTSGVPDECELEGNDCNANGIFDDCEFSDCNDNCVDDADDIANLTSADCNTNGVPDKCEISGNDCNTNGILDECDVADCDGDPGCSDCNLDGRPDECGVPLTCRASANHKLTPSDGETGDGFGSSVSLSGDTAVVGARSDDCQAGYDCGSAYIYRFDGTAWIEEQKLTASDAAAYDYFGSSVSVSGNTALVGAYGGDCKAGGDCGLAYVYRFDGAMWIEEQKLTASDAAVVDYFGFAVSVSGDTAVIGAYRDDCKPGDDCGAAYVYRFDGTAWIEKQKLSATDAGSTFHFGTSVSLSGETAVIGAGASAHVYRFDGANWIPEQTLTAAASGFGNSVSVSGDTAAVGAQYGGCPGSTYTTGCGAAYVYRFDGKSWIEEQKLIASDTAQSHAFGASVSVSGDTVVVGAVRRESAYVYRFNGATWIEEQKLTAPVAATHYGFGRAASVSGNIVLVNAGRGHCVLGSGCGSAYLFDVSRGLDCNCNGVADVCDIADCDGDSTCGDCNTNSVPDECELVDNDCNDNSLPDECDLAAPTLLFADDFSVCAEFRGGSFAYVSDNALWLTVQNAECAYSGPDAVWLRPDFSYEPPYDELEGLLESATVDLHGASSALLSFEVLKGDTSEELSDFYIEYNDGESWRVLLRESDHPWWKDPEWYRRAIVIPRSAMTSSFRFRFRASTSELYGSSGWSVANVTLTRTEGDCDGDGVLDVCETRDGFADDCNLNGIPDPCDIERAATDGGIGYDAGWASQAIASGDIDNDGDVDLIIGRGETTYGYGIVTVLFNDGHGNFHTDTSTNAETGGWARSIAVADLDGDGDLDVVVSAYWVAVVINRGGSAAWGGFEREPRFLTTEDLTQAVNTADFDNDGDIDIGAAVGEFFEDDGIVQLWLNDGHAVFTEVAGFPVGNTPRRIEFADVNGDGWTDCIVVNQMGRNVATALNRGADSNAAWLGFAEPTVVDMGSTAFHVAIGDLNRDSRPDLVVVAFTEGLIRVLINAGNDGAGEWLGYETRRDFAVGQGPTVTTLEDANFDGLIDVIVALDGDRQFDDDQQLAMLENLGLDSSSNWLGFAPPVSIGDIRTSPYDVAAIDVNDDGARDFIVANRGAGPTGSYTGPSRVVVFRQIRPATTDCNRNTLPDDCDIAAATSVDCDENGMPDECEPDCNDNGVVDACDLSSETSFDCNENDVLDDCELAAGEATDCDNNTTLDVCELPFTFTAEFGPFGPTWAYQPGEHVIEAPPPPSSDVYVTVETSARLSAAARYEVYLNDLLIRDLFEGVEIACTGEPAVESFVISAEMFVELVGGGDAIFKVFAWGGPCSWRIDHVSYYRLSVSYESDPGTDCDGSGVLDVCEDGGGDCNDNGVADLCESDADGDGVIDDCDECPESSVGETIVVNGCETRVVNQVFGDGCTMFDDLAACGEEGRNHGAYVSCVARVANSWRRDGMISDDEHGQVVSCAAKQRIGRSLSGASHTKNEPDPQK